MKVVHVTTSYTEKGGGVAHILSNLLDLMPSSCLVTFKEKDDTCYLPIPSKCKFVAIPYQGSEKFRFSLVFLIKLFHLQPSIIHVHGFWMYHLLASSLYSFCTATPLLISPHGMLEITAFNHKSTIKRVYLFLLRLFLRSSLVSFHCLTTQEELDLARLKLGRFHSVTIPNGINFSDFCVKGFYRSHVGNHILYFSRVTPKKKCTFAS